MPATTPEAELQAGVSVPAGPGDLEMESTGPAASSSAKTGEPFEAGASNSAGEGQPGASCPAGGGDPGTSSSTVPNNMTASDADVTHSLFTSLQKSETVGEEVQKCVKDCYLSCQLVVPGITLKKFKQSLTHHPDRAGKYMAILSRDECKMYKIQKPRLCSMVAGDAQSVNFWDSAEAHCKNWRVGGVFLFDTFAGDLKQAAVAKFPGVSCTNVDMEQGCCVQNHWRFSTYLCMLCSNTC